MLTVLMKMFFNIYNCPSILIKKMNSGKTDRCSKMSRNSTKEIKLAIKKIFKKNGFLDQFSRN